MPKTTTQHRAIRRQSKKLHTMITKLFVFIIICFIHTLVLSPCVFAMQHCSRRRIIARFASLCFLGQNFAEVVANAACLPGDLSPDCIGVYKVPIDDSILPYTGTESALKRFAPDTRYVPPIKGPSSVNEALKSLKEQRLAADAIVSAVTAGQLEDAGIMVLKLLPQVTLAGHVLLDTDQQKQQVDGASAPIQSLRRQQLENSVEQVYVLWNSVDIMIGQGIRGEMGATIVAQLAILSEIKDAIRALDDLIVAFNDS